MGDIRTIEDTLVVKHTSFCRIKVIEVRKALKQMKKGKAMGPNDIPIEAWKCLGVVGEIWLTRLFIKILMIKKMPDE